MTFELNVFWIIWGPIVWFGKLQIIKTGLWIIENQSAALTTPRYLVFVVFNRYLIVLLSMILE